MEVKAILQLRKDLQLSQPFLDKVAGPVANKLFEMRHDPLMGPILPERHLP
jgi:hypothetical protein